jgi:hypothetical protein
MQTEEMTPTDFLAEAWEKLWHDRVDTVGDDDEALLSLVLEEAKRRNWSREQVCAAIEYWRVAMIDWVEGKAQSFKEQA